MDEGVAAIGVLIAGMLGGVITWMLGPIVFGAFVGGASFSALGVGIVAWAY